MTVATPAVDRVTLPGPLTLAIMGLLWRDDRNLGSIHRRLCEEYKPIALSTLSTTLTRLIERGWIVRNPHRRYHAIKSRTELILEITELIDSV